MCRMDSVADGSIKSCGCLYRNVVGLSSADYEKLFGVWENMNRRCYCENTDRFYAYGAKGITVCDEWRNDFRGFAKWAVENGWKPTLTIERKDVRAGYMPSNCCFITMKEQARNKTSNVRIIHNGQDKCIAEWCEITGAKAKNVYPRYKRGIRDFDILFYPGDLRELRSDVN